MMGPITFQGLFHQVELERLEEWANVTKFIRADLGLSVEEPECARSFREVLLIMYGQRLGTRILRYTTIVIEQLKALRPGFCKMTTYKRYMGPSEFIVGLLRYFESSSRDLRNPGAPGNRVGPWAYLVDGVEVNHITLVFCFSVCSAIQ